MHCGSSMHDAHVEGRALSNGLIPNACRNTERVAIRRPPQRPALACVLACMITRLNEKGASLSLLDQDRPTKQPGERTCGHRDLSIHPQSHPIPAPADSHLGTATFLWQPPPSHLKHRLASRTAGMRSPSTLRGHVPPQPALPHSPHRASGSACGHRVSMYRHSSGPPPSGA